MSDGNELLAPPDDQPLMVPFVEAIAQEVHLEAGGLLLTRPFPNRDPRSTRLHEMQAGQLSKHLVITDQCALQSQSGSKRPRSPKHCSDPRQTIGQVGANVSPTTPERHGCRA